MESRLIEMTDGELIKLRQQINNVLSHRRAARRETVKRHPEKRPAWVDALVMEVAAEHKRSSRELLAPHGCDAVVAAKRDLWARLRRRGHAAHRIAVWFNFNPTTVRFALSRTATPQPEKRAA